MIEDPLKKCRAIVFVPGDPVPKKYNTVDAREAGLRKFQRDMRVKFPTYSAINVYLRTGEFYKQVK